MDRLFRTLGPSVSGPPPVVVKLLTVELVAVVAFLVLGTSLSDVLKSAGLPIALMLALLNPTVQEPGRASPTQACRVVKEIIIEDLYGRAKNGRATGLLSWHE